MNWKGWSLFGVLALIVVGALAFVFMRPATQVPFLPENPEALEGQSIYVTGEYGFMLTYPDTARLEETFSPDYHLAPGWRAYTGPEATGTPLLALIAYETESDDSYPRYYRAMVRVGVSDDAGEVALCETLTPDAGEEALPDVELNGTTWKAFSFQDAGMMQYVRGISYRVVHEGKCFAMEKIAAGSSYRDDPESAKDIPDATLEAEYAKLDAIVSSFTFVSP